MVTVIKTKRINLSENKNKCAKRIQQDIAWRVRDGL